MPGLAGFFSKDEILYRTFASGHAVLWAVGAITSLMTAFYMFRLVFLAFHGERRQAHDGPHGTAPCTHRTCTTRLRSMAIPLIVLAIGSVLAGYLNVPAALGGSALLEHFLEPSLHVPAMEGAHAAAEHADHGVELIADGRVVAHRARRHRHRGVPVSRSAPSCPDAFAARFPACYRFLVNKGYVDELYDAVVVQPIKALSEHVLWKADAMRVSTAPSTAPAGSSSRPARWFGRCRPDRCAPTRCRCSSALC